MQTVTAILMQTHNSNGAGCRWKRSTADHQANHAVEYSKNVGQIRPSGYERRACWREHNATSGIISWVMVSTNTAPHAGEWYFLSKLFPQCEQ